MHYFREQGNTELPFVCVCVCGGGGGGGLTNRMQCFP